ncbi:hypothetical protein PROFUN_13448 [Planoprotostelium fungivorum]|uniref:Uncharacterized protein n=1 Tax=Planoprotostelium fungivorum TaxID=1890364 RepID=A0A2P6N3X7_9EUKA|nr:hypothetical protein PROFUN_16095 [Planoprotostelium fungivorum]PRP78667.1 hypothetical protein PROFUN_13448 [Planoprotostelium fungivorum]
MGRTILLDHNSVNNARIKYLTDFKNSIPFEIGLLVGQICPDKDYVYALVPSPSQDPDQKMTLANMDDSWISDHAKLTSGMLAGGLELNGIYIMCLTDQYNKMENRLGQLLSNMYKKMRYPQDLDLSDERAILHIDAKTRKLTGKHFNMKDRVFTGRIAAVKFNPLIQSENAVNVHKFTTFFPLDLTIDISNNERNDTLSTHVEKAVEKLILSLNENLLSIDGTIVESSDPDAKPMDQLLMKFLGKTKVHQVEFYKKLQNKQTGATFTDSSSAGHVTLHGTIHSITFVHAKEPLSTALKLIQRDIYNSVVTRIRLVIQDQATNPLTKSVDVTEKTGHIQLPKRVYLPLFGANDEQTSTLAHSQMASDYLFEDETKEDSLSRWEEMFSLKAVSEEEKKTESVETIPIREKPKKVEKVVEREKKITPSRTIDTTTDGPSDRHPIPKNAGNRLTLPLIIVAVLFLILAFFVQSTE